MCGIAGIVYQGSPEEGRSIISKMTDALVHRGPDREGIFIDGSVFLGHRRLSIIDLSENANQPMTDISGRYTIVFNGEIYNYREIKAEIKNYAWKSNSDCEVLLAAWIQWGKAALPKLAGMFSFAIYDKLEKSIFLARDRFGVKPLYYTNRRGHFAFASEIRSILASGLSDRQLNNGALHEFLCYQSVSAPQTLVEGIFTIGPGEFLTWNQGVLVNGKWWDLCREVEVLPSSVGKEEIRGNILSLFRQSVARRMVSDVPVAAFLSGGIDSSAVVAMMAQLSPNPVDTFSVIFNEKDYDESRYSSLIAKKYSTRHHPILLKPSSFLESLPAALAAMDHPSGDGPNSYVVSKVTHEAGIKVALSGLGGDEIFAGYPFFKRISRIHRNIFLRYSPAIFKNLGARLAKTIPGGRRGQILSSLLKLEKTDLQNLFPAYRVLFTAEKAEAMVKITQDKMPVQEWLQNEKNNLARLPLLSQVSAAEITHYLHNVLLRDTDQMSMAHSLEVREPFLDHELVKYVLGVPDKIKYPSTPKKLLTDSLGNLLPDEVVHRKKMGFTFPWNHWLKNDLAGWCEKNFAKLEQRSVFKIGSAKAVWEKFRKGDKQVPWNQVWLLAVLEEWMENNSIRG